MHLTMSINQILVAGLVLAFLVMAGAVVVLALHGLKLMKSVDGLVETSKGVAVDAGEAVKDTVAKVGANATQINKAATGVAVALVVRRGLRKFHQARKAKRLLAKAGKRKGRK